MNVSPLVSSRPPGYGPLCFGGGGTGTEAKPWKVVHKELGPYREGLPGPEKLQEMSSIHTKG